MQKESTIFILIVVLFVSVFVIFYYFYGSAPDPEKTDDEKVCFLDKNKEDLCVYVELAETPEEQARGLMYRESLAEDRGMLFIYETEMVRGFWMKNMNIHLDMIWIDEDKEVVYIHRDVPPCSTDPCPTYRPDKESMYVLEVNSGFSEKNDIEVGDSVLF